MAEGVYVGADVLPTDDDPSGAGAWPSLLWMALILVEEAGVTGLMVGGVDGRLRRARLLQVEDAGNTGRVGKSFPPAGDEIWA